MLKVAELLSCWVAEWVAGLLVEQAQWRPASTRRGSVLSSFVSSSSPRDRLCRRRLADGVELSVAEVEPLHFGERHRARADAVEDRDLIAAFVDGAIAVESLRHRERRTVRAARGDEARRGTRAE